MPTCLGILPHQIRGHMSHFRIDTLLGHINPNCVACSHRVLEEYKKDNTAFVRMLSDHPDALQALSGLGAILDGVRELSLEAFDETLY